MSQPPSTPSKLFIRSEVLAVIGLLNTLDNPSRQDKFKQFKRLQKIDDQETVQLLLVKELQRASTPHILQIVSDLLMEVGRIETLQGPLWAIIRSPQSIDTLKDAANIILRHLGDPTDPNLYLEYLDDPAGLINRETERMLEVSARNPEALIDFIDFIFSLPAHEQCNLILSLRSDYEVDYLLNIFLPALTASLPMETTELLLSLLGEMRSSRAALFLNEYHDWFQADPAMARIIKKSANALKIAGCYREEQLEETRQKQSQPHPLIHHSSLYQCFATISDGIGNQGIVISRQRENGDVMMMSVAINDIHGIIDCFGFYELSQNDFQKLIAKFHEESTKIDTPYTYCLHRLQEAEQLNHLHHFRIPYEYSCWKVLLNDPALLPEQALDTISLCQEWANPDWTAMSTNLYQHPDFSTWFLEEDDHPVVTSMLENVLALCVKTVIDTTGDDKEAPIQEVAQAFIERLDQLAITMVHELLTTEWRQVMIHRLADAAYLLNEQDAKTFSCLAATEVWKLLSYQGYNTPLEGFIKHYGRRCIEECLLRLKQGLLNPVTPDHTPFQATETFEYLVDNVLSVWEV